MRVSLKYLNSFSVDASAQNVIVVQTESELFRLWQKFSKNSSSALIIGSGSNVLFLEDYSGSILLNRISGITIREDVDDWHIHVGAGELWHNLVNMCLNKHIPGLENLALIPGRVGSAPIQNIGAYGVEFKDFCEYVDVMQLDTGVKYRLSSVECEFQYRDSIFKKELRKNFAIVSVGLRLTKSWKPVLHYGILSKFNDKNLSPKEIYNIICKLRLSKFPNLSQYGNAGSFFKNPIVSKLLANNLLHSYPEMPYYYQSDGTVKLSAGWLIDQCGLRGYSFNHAAVYEKQALILININKVSTGKNIAALSYYIRNEVVNRFSVLLEPEVRFIGIHGEINVDKVIT